MRRASFYPGVFVCAAAMLPACASSPTEAPAYAKPTRELSVGFVVVDGVYNTELVAPYDVFHHVQFHAQPAMRVFTVAPSRAPIRTFEGLTITPDFAFDAAPPIDVLVVPSAQHSLDTDLDNAQLIAFVRERGATATWVLSLCDGAFVLARAGLLDKRHATTFPSDLDAFEARFPGVLVRRGPSFVRADNCLTSQGGARSFEAALYLAELLYGPEAARGIARGICIDWNIEDVDFEAWDGGRELVR